MLAVSANPGTPASGYDPSGVCRPPAPGWLAEVSHIPATPAGFPYTAFCVDVLLAAYP